MAAALIYAEKLAPLAKATLKWTMEQLVSTKLQGYFSDGLASLSDGTDTEQILHKIDGVLKEVQQTKETTKKLSQKLDEGFLHLRKDELRNHMESINTFFETIQDCTAQALEDKRTIQDSAQLEKRLGELDKRQEKELIRVVDKVPELLNHINGFLTDGDFIKKAAELALRDSKDFLSYYKKIEMLFTSYWGTVVQGIVLLNMAHLSKRVHFEESPQTIKKHGEKLLKQVNDFYEVLGHELCLIAQSVLAAANSPGAQVPVYFSSGWGKGIGIEIHWKQVKKNWWDNLISWAAKTDSLAPSQWGYQALKVVKSDDHYKYFLEPITDIAPGKDFNIAKAYPMRLCGGNLAIKNRLNRFSGVEGVDAIQDPAGPNAISMDTDSNFDWREESSDWHIRPVSVGGNNFYFEAAGYRGGEPDHSVLVTSTRDDELEWRDNLDPSEGFAASLNRAYFQLRPAS